MLKPCGKVVQTRRTIPGKTIGQLSTVLPTPHFIHIATRVKALVSPKVVRTFPQDYSPVKIAFLPLIEHYFYPVSTGPTISTTK